MGILIYPGILPLVWHGYNISVKQLSPLCFRVPSIEPVSGWGRHLRVTSQPVFNDVMVELFAPQQASVGLTRHLGFLWSQAS